MQRSTKKILTILLNNSAAPGATVVAGHFTPDFVIYQINQSGETFLQVHTSKQNLDLVAAIDSEVINFDVLDLA